MTEWENEQPNSPEWENARVRIVFGDQTLELDTTDPSAVVQKIREITADAGVSRYHVAINDRLVSPQDFTEKFNEALEDGDVTITILRVEKAG